MGKGGGSVDAFRIMATKYSLHFDIEAKNDETGR